MKNFAFIDEQNVNLGIASLGWKLDWRKFRIYLNEKYSIAEAYLFIGYIPEQKDLYTNLQRWGYILVFKPVIFDPRGKVKGNCDADLVLYAITEGHRYDKAMIISSDGDFHSLVRYLYQKGKLETVMSHCIEKCSALLKKKKQKKKSDS